MEEIAPMKTRLALLVLALAAALPAAQAQTGKWPDKQVRVVLPFSPGGSTDIVARLIAAGLSQEFGQQFIVDNRAGASGIIGTEIVVRANPDGYTLLVAPSTYAANAALYKLPYDPIKDIATVTRIITGSFILAVHPSVKAINLKEFIELARAKPGALNYSSPGTGSTGHLAAELFRQMTKTDLVHVPYKGEAPAIIDLIGGQIQFYFGGPLAMMPPINAGKLRGLAVTSEQRSDVMPDLPAVSEQVPGYSVIIWYGMWAPLGTPREIVSQLNQTIARILKKPEMQKRLRADVMEAAHSTPEEFSSFIARDIAKWTKVVKIGNVKVD
jgi:tripartite-type tricarboxylate transporter receptor subunit TctC